jgi:hypothetical protein
MIRRLRDRHRWLVLLVALITALVLALTLPAGRDAEPPSRPAGPPR